MLKNKILWFSVLTVIIVFLIMVLPSTKAIFVKEEIEVSEVRVVQENFNTKIVGKVKNTTSHEVEISSFRLILLDSDKEVFNQEIYVGSSFRQFEEKAIDITVSGDISSFDDFKSIIKYQ